MMVAVGFDHQLVGGAGLQRFGMANAEMHLLVLEIALDTAEIAAQPGFQLLDLFLDGANLVGDPLLLGLCFLPLFIPFALGPGQFLQSAVAVRDALVTLQRDAGKRRGAAEQHEDTCGNRPAHSARRALAAVELNGG
jgi:hypothetical protein